MLELKLDQTELRIGRRETTYVSFALIKVLTHPRDASPRLWCKLLSHPTLPFIAQWTFLFSLLVKIWVAAYVMTLRLHAKRTYGTRTVRRHHATRILCHFCRPEKSLKIWFYKLTGLSGLLEAGAKSFLQLCHCLWIGENRCWSAPASPRRWRPRSGGPVVDSISGESYTRVKLCGECMLVYRE